MNSKQDIDWNEYLKNMLSGVVSETDREHLQAYIHASYQDEELDKLMSKHWSEIQNSRTGEHDLYFRQLKNRVWTKITARQRKTEFTKSPLMEWKSYLVRIAAILFIPLLISSVYLSYRLSQLAQETDQVAMQQVFASPGSRVQFTLPDQSVVWLNSGSSLEYPVNFARLDKRKVKLTGQGYFEVSHAKDQAFIVETGELNIRVLGTSFDVSNYSNDQLMSSTLERGAIALLNSKGEEVARLVPGQQAVLDKDSRKLYIEDVDTRLTTSWKDGRLIFKNTPLQEVTKQLERWYNCSIHVAPELLDAEILYTATIQDETLVEVLQMIEISTNVNTKIENREVRIME
ncbi:FecR domain-containing protein [uncultured Sunxiuqinia sp.]|uniref:FecR family protein n=1 Tax=uncultured Sunxiuqinia sp. TaxID=1573825 RepID=UPI0030D9FC2A